MSFWAENRQPDLATLPGGFPVGRSVLAAMAGVLSICPILCQILLPPIKTVGSVINVTECHECQ